MTGYERCEQVTKANGKSFAFAAFALPLPKRQAAYAVYAFFRRLDDAFDVSGGDVATLHHARQVVRWLFGDIDSVDPGGWPREELDALKDAIEREGLPRAPFDEMIAGMEMDLVEQTYDDDKLELYCNRVAGTVGEIMAVLLQSKEREAAMALGRAMQLTNILRDVKEDAERGRTYLPGVWPETGMVHVQKARALYAQASDGAKTIPTFWGRWLVEMMARIYGDILRVIERRNYDVFSERARVGWGRKVWLACVAFVAAVRR